MVESRGEAPRGHIGSYWIGGQETIQPLCQVPPTSMLAKDDFYIF